MYRGPYNRAFYQVFRAWQKDDVMQRVWQHIELMHYEHGRIQGCKIQVERSRRKTVHKPLASVYTFKVKKNDATGRNTG